MEKLPPENMNVVSRQEDGVVLNSLKEVREQTAIKKEEFFQNSLAVIGFILVLSSLIIAICFLFMFCFYTYHLITHIELLQKFLTDTWEVIRSGSVLGIILTYILQQNYKDREQK